MLGVAVSLFMLLVSLMIRPIGVYQIIQKHVVVSCLYPRPLTLVTIPLYSSRFRFFLLRLLSSFSHSSCIFLVFPFFTLESLFFRDLSTKELLVDSLGFNFKDEIIYQLKKISLIFDLKSEQGCIIHFL